MRAFPILLALAGMARADGLPEPTDKPPSDKARNEAAGRWSTCNNEPKCLIATIKIDPSNMMIRTVLADAYYASGDKTAALAVLAQLEASACVECLREIVHTGGHPWADDAKFTAELAKGLHGRRTAYTPAAEAVKHALLAGDWAQVAPFVPKAGVRFEPDDGLLTPAQIRDLMKQVSSDQVSIRASGLMTCEGDCCYEIWNMLGGDEPKYLEGMCFAPGPVLVSTQWDSLR